MAARNEARRRRRGTRPGLTREASRALTRARLLAAARVEFARHGLQGTSLTDILRRAEVSPGAFYHHFGDKQDLFLAVVDELSAVSRRMLRESRAVLRSPGGDMVAWIEGLFVTSLELVDHNRELFQIYAREVSSGNAKFKEFFEHDRALFRREIAESLDEMIAGGHLPPCDSDWAAYLIGVVVLTALLEQVQAPSDRPAWCRAMAQFLLAGVPGLQRLPARPPRDEPMPRSHASEPAA